MNKTQGKSKSKQDRKQVPATGKNEQENKSTELTDKDLEKVSGGGAQPHMTGIKLALKI